MRPRRWIFVCFPLVVLAVELITGPARSQAQTVAPPELTTTNFQTAHGNIHVYLPSDIAAGDTISGTVAAEPAGANPKEKDRNAKQLNALVIQVESQRWPVSGGVIRKLMIASTLTIGPKLILLDEKGKQIGSAEAPITTEPRTNTRSNFMTPSIVQSGFSFPVIGPFDGDSTNTSVRIGSHDARVIAESPRGAIVETPSTVVGPMNIAVNDNGHTTTGSLRAIKIDLTAPKTSLLKGESTELHVTVQGLEGIREPIQIRIQNQSPTNINLAGGNSQNVTVQPSQVTSSGTFNWSTNITGVGTGGFNITGTVPVAAAGESTGSTSTNQQQQPTPTPSNGVPANKDQNLTQVGFTASELRKHCDELQKQIDEVKRPCDSKQRECDSLSRKLDAARTTADKTQADYDAKKREFDAAMQNLLASVIAAARAKGFDTKLSLNKESDKYVPLELAKGIVIYFDASGLESQNFIDNLADALRQLVASNLLKELKRIAAELEGDSRKNQTAIDARRAAKEALDKCVAERDALCPRVKELESELARCKRDATNQAEIERQAEEKAQAARQAAEVEKQRQADAAKKRQADEAKAREQLAAQAEENRRTAEALATKRRLCNTCLKLFVDQAIAQANLSSEQKSALDQFLSKLDQLSDGLQKAQTVADFIPQLNELADLLGKLNAAKDVVDRVNTAIRQIQQLASSGGGPAQLGTALQLFSGALDAAAQAVPILGPLASYFKVLADSVVAATQAAYKLRDIEGFKNASGTIDAEPCARLVTIYQNNNGDLDAVYESLFDQKTREETIRETPEMRTELKQVILARMRECCLRFLKTDCPILK